jgi:hypothetical protein
MFRMQNEQGLDSFDDLFVCSEGGGRPVNHRQEVLNVAEVLVWREDGESFVEAVAGGSYCGGTAEDAVDVDVAFGLCVIDINTNKGRVRLRIEAREH